MCICKNLHTSTSMYNIIIITLRFILGYLVYNYTAAGGSPVVSECLLVASGAR